MSMCVAKASKAGKLVGDIADVFADKFRQCKRSFSVGWRHNIRHNDI